MKKTTTMYETKFFSLSVPENSSDIPNNYPGYAAVAVFGPRILYWISDLSLARIRMSVLSLLEG